ncbi:MAG TPA: hypothetical protein ENK60_05585 [Anaerolineae bacterium]|nr:hypothetical protein [Anaerolineae bacterium]
MSMIERRFLRILVVYALALLGLHLLVSRIPTTWAFFWYPPKLVGEGGRLAPEEWLWGVYPYTYLARWLQFAFAAGVGAWTLWLGFGRDTPWKPLGFPSRPHTQALLALASFPLFWFGRTVHTRWGDAYILVKGIAHPDVRLTYNWQAPLDTYLHAQLFRLGERLWGWEDALPAYWILSSMAGVLAVWVLLKLAENLGRTHLERWVVFGVMVTLGTMQLFFGYPENYTIISLLMLTFFWLGWRVVQGIGSLWGPSIVLALAHGFHPSTLFLQPAMAFLVWWLWRRRGEPVAQVLAAWLLPVLVVLVGVLALMTAGGHGLDAFLGPEAPGGGDHRWWVPLSQPTGEWEYYTLFSRGHLMDILNEQWLTQPFTLITLALLLIFFWRTWPRDAYSGFLLLAAGAYLFLIFTWNPDYGGQRDWDLFSTAAWPATLLMAYWLIRTLGTEALLRTGGVLIAHQLLYTAAWVYSNTRPWEWS